MEAKPFAGFSGPQKNFSELPHELIEALPIFTSLAELKVVLYILRHTWGYHDYDEGKRITLDEFENGRKRRDGTRIDKGTGMVKSSLVDGIKRAVAHGFIEVEEDNSDKAREQRFYTLVLFENQTPDVRLSNSSGMKVKRRSEKTTIETNLEGSSASPSSAPKKKLLKDWLYELVMLRSFKAVSTADRKDNNGRVLGICSALRRERFGGSYRATSVAKLEERLTLVKELRTAYRWHANQQDEFGEPLSPPQNPRTVKNLLRRYRDSLVPFVKVIVSPLPDPKCLKCRGNGVIFTREDGYEFADPCECVKAREL